MLNPLLVVRASDVNFTIAFVPYVRKVPGVGGRHNLVILSSACGGL